MATLDVAKLFLSAVFLCYFLQLTPVTSIPIVGFKDEFQNRWEYVGMVTVSLERTNETNITTTVTISLGGSATRNSDYVVADPLVVTFPANDQSTKSIRIKIINDLSYESVQSIVLTIQADPAIYRKDGFSVHTVNIVDNEVSITCQNTRVNESDGYALIKVTKAGTTPSVRQVSHSITCFTWEDTALPPADYSTTNSVFTLKHPSLTKSVNITITNDDVPEEDETFKVWCYSYDARVRVQSSCKGAVVTIQNDDTYAFICPGGHSGTVSEDAGSYSVDICRVGVLSVAQTIQLCRTTEGGVVPSVTETCDNVAFQASSNRTTGTITITDDLLGETELLTFQIYLQSSDPAVTINDTTRENVTLVDNDNTFSFSSVSEIQMTEGSGADLVNVTIQRIGKTSVSASVRLVLNFTATAVSADCTGTSPNVVTFAGGVTSRTITACTVVDDRLVEDDETFNVTISGDSGSNVVHESSERTIKLISDDVRVTCQGASLKEAYGPATISLGRTGATAITANDVSCSTADGTALNPTDYSLTLTTVSFALDQLKNTSDVFLQDDRVVEANETFTVTCTTPDVRVVVDSSCSGIVINIINDDTYVYFCPGYSTAIEENVGSYTVRLCRVGVLEDSHTVRLCRSSDSVSLPRDYPAVQAQCDDIVFAAYEEVKELVIPVTNDTWGEQEYKTFNISMNTTDAGVTFNDTTSYVVTIHDDDNTFCFTRTTPKVYEEHDKFVNLTIRRTGAITVSNASTIINTSPQSAITPEDYTEPILNQRITFFVGEIIKNVSVKIINDKIVEDDQTFQLSLTGVNGSTVFPDCKRSTVIVGSNNVLIFCRDQRGRQFVHENKGPVLMEFTREGSLEYNHTMRIRTVDGTAIFGQDFTAIDKTLTFAPYQTSMRENVVIMNDNVVEPDEAFRLSVTSSDDRVYMICPGSEITIVNDDTFIRCANQSIEVNEGDKTVNITLRREGVLSSASPFWFSTKDGTAVAKSDYKPQNKTSRTFLPGQVYMTLRVPLVDDGYKENAEYFSVVIGSYIPTTLTSGDNCVVITIKDDDRGCLLEQQPLLEELVGRRINYLLVAGIGGGFIALVVILFIVCICYYFRRNKYTKKGEKETKNGYSKPVNTGTTAL